MHPELKGRVAIVTGGGQGVGKGIARRLARNGMTVVIGEINAETGPVVARECDELGGRGIYLHTDCTQKDSVLALVDAALAQFGTVDVLVNNAYASGGIARLHEKPDEHFRLAFEGSYFSALWAMQRVFKPMRAQQRGRIINLCTLNGVNAHLYSADYNSSKEALRALTRSAAREWAQYGITANAICPAAVTPAFERFEQAAPELAARMLQQNPMGRMGDPEEDIGGVAAFLASDASQYLTGNTLYADGGGHINGVQWAPPMPPEAE